MLMLYEIFNKITPIPESEWEKIHKEFKYIEFNKGDLLQIMGHVPKDLFIITSGIAKSSYLDKDGKEFIKNFFSANDIASAYIEVLRGIPSRVEIKALEKGCAYTFPFQKIQSLYDSHPCWDKLGRIIAEKFFIMKEQREYEFLMLDAKERYLNFKKQFGDLENKIPNHQIALYLGITPVSLSRIKSQK